MYVWCIFFFFKQKTAYEMRISDWSSDVCSSDLPRGGAVRGANHSRTNPASTIPRDKKIADTVSHADARTDSSCAVRPRSAQAVSRHRRGRRHLVRGDRKRVV